MDHVFISIDELNVAITNAVNAALDARDNAEDATTLISREATAKRLGVDLSTLWRWDKTGYLKPDTRIGRSVWYMEKTILRLERGEKHV